MVCSIASSLADKAKGEQAKGTILQRVKKNGGGTLSEDDIGKLINLRLSLSSQISEVFRLCQFQAIGNRVRVKPHDFAVIARVEARAAWCKIAMLLSQFYAAMGAAGAAGPASSSDITFAGREEIYATRLSSQVFKAFEEHEPSFILAVEAYIKQLLRHYSVADGVGDSGKLVDARSAFLADAGKHLLKAAKLISDAKVQAQATQQSDDAALATSLEKAFRRFRPDCEARFRERLIEARAFSSASGPLVLFQPIEDAKDGKKRKAEASSAATAQKDIQPVEFDSAGNAILTEAHVFSRLCIGAFGEEVLWLNAARPEVKDENGVTGVVKVERVVTDGAVKVERAVADDGTLGTAGGAVVPAREKGDTANVTTGGCVVRLLSLSLPRAEVVPSQNADAERFFVQVDDLVPIPQEKKSKCQRLSDPAMGTVDDDMLLVPFELEINKATFFQTLCAYALQCLHAASLETWGSCRSYVLSDRGKLPILLQACASSVHVAPEAQLAKKGEFVLLPLTDRIHLAGTDQADMLLEGDASVIHEIHVQHARVIIRGYQKKEKQPKVTEEVILGSPLLAAKDKKGREKAIDFVPPFWCLGRCRSLVASNMVLDSLVYEVPPLAAVGSAKSSIPPPYYKFTLQLDVAKNTAKITNGDRLLLPFLGDREGAE